MEIGLVGAGNIARVIADNAKDYEVVCVYDAVKKVAQDFAKKYKCKFLRPEEFPKMDLVVEAASQQAVVEYGEKLLKKGQSLMVMSVGAFVEEGLFDRLRKAAESNRVKLVLPSGAIAGLDGLKSASVGKIEGVTLTTTKPPGGFGMAIKKRTVLYEGPAREAVKKFPQNVNVAATLSLVGLGFDKTNVRIGEDPDTNKNEHEIYAKGEFGELRIQVRNVPSPQNPKTSYLAAMSAVSAIRSFKESVVIG
ncbi:MAG: aspartate dehydrogenase [candidate division WOR-3 bacterium]